MHNLIKMNKLLIFLLIQVFCFLPNIDAAAQTKTIETPLYSEAVTRQGAEYRPIFAEAIEAIKNGDRELAEVKLNSVVTYCESKSSLDSVKVVSVANQDEFDYFMTTLKKDTSVVWLDMVCPATYKMLAFLYIDKGKVNLAISSLERATQFAPLWAEPHTELGYIMNKLGNFKKAETSYKYAIKLADQFESSKDLKPMALRGLGFSLTELGDLDGAQKAYEESLLLEPDNKNAPGELKYIDELRARH